MYIAAEEYPEGAVDMSGHRVDSNILGGVVPFDRPWPLYAREELYSVYLHPDHDRDTYQICKSTGSKEGKAVR